MKTFDIETVRALRGLLVTEPRSHVQWGPFGTRAAVVLAGMIVTDVWEIPELSPDDRAELARLMDAVDACDLRSEDAIEAVRLHAERRGGEA